ncbi:hypothetical protein C8F01DRAFT_1144054 [Mycena amicta]|nr:hypothetical protein C8F01DRAFT_1144054 [Mycena amicta]
MSPSVSAPRQPPIPLDPPPAASEPSSSQPSHSSPTPQASPTDGPRHLAMLCRNALPHATAAKPRQPWSTPPSNALPPETAVARVAKIFCRRLPAVLTSNLHVAVETSSNPLQAASMQSWSLGTTTTQATGYRDMRGIHLSPKLSPSAVHCLAARTCLCLRTEVCFPRLISGIDCHYGFLTIRNAVVQGQYQVGLHVVGPVLCIVHMC